MKIFLGTFVLSLFFLAFSFGETDTTQNSQIELDQLRKEYLSDKAALDQINQTKDRILEKNKDQKMPNTGMEKSARGMVQVIPNIERSRQSLLRTSPNGQKSWGTEKRNRTATEYFLTVSYYERHSLLANAIMNLYNHDLDKERAKFFVKLLKPSFNTKTEDFFHFFKLPVEPQDWSVQTAYSLANLRTGNPSTARKENKKLIKKGSKFADLQKKKEEKGKDSRYAKRLLEFHLQRALIEAHDGKEKEARKFLATALEMNSSAELDPNIQKLERKQSLKSND